LKKFGGVGVIYDAKTQRQQTTSYRHGNSAHSSSTFLQVHHPQRRLYVRQISGGKKAASVFRWACSYLEGGFC
jgi:6-phosphogluconolactonase (cycloisomerase 2 family)